MEHSENAFRDFFENGEICMHMVGNDGTILEANKAELDFLGYSAAEYIGHNIAEFHVDPAVATELLRRLSSGESIRRETSALRLKDGAIKHVQITSSGHVRDGRLVHTCCFMIDITEQRNAENLCAQIERKYLAMLEAIPAAIYTTDAEGRITYFNPATVELSGRRPDISSDRWCVTSRLFKLDGSPLPHDECPMAIALKENREVRDEEAIAERPDGTLVRFLAFPTPLHDESGRVTGAIDMLMDVTQLRQAETDAARMAAIVESSNDAIISKTLDGRIVSWNEGAARVFGFEAAEMIGAHITRIIPPELQTEEQQIINRLRRGERIQHYDTIRMAKDGRRLDISLSVSPIRDKSGRVIGASKVARDVGERKRAEAMKTLLIAELNHRVKNALATVQAIAQQTLRRAKSPQDFTANFTGRLNALASAHTLLTESKWEGVNLSDLLRSQVLVGRDEDPRLTYGGPATVLEPHLALQLALLLHELGTNARKYGALSGPDGSVVFNWSVTNDEPRELHLSWTENCRREIVAPTTTGFGSALIEQIVKASGGNAHMLCNAHGISWTINMKLPEGENLSLQSDAQTTSRASAFENADDRLSELVGKRVLVVEDEAIIALEIVQVLTDYGIDVVGPASTIEEAERLIWDQAADGIDAAVLDRNLAGRKIDPIASILTRRRIPFIFLTGYGKEGLPTDFERVVTLQKPFIPLEIHAALLDIFRMNRSTVVKLHS